MSCDSCVQERINGFICHETGCPEAWKDKMIFCDFCDSLFKPETRNQKFCCADCAASYFGETPEVPPDAV